MIAKYIVVGWLALGALLTVATVGMARKPVTPGVAASAVVINAGLIVLIVLAWPTGGGR